MSAPLPAGLTDEQRLLAETLDRFATERVVPRADAIEADGLPDDLLAEAFGEQLLQLAALPEELGGAGGDLPMALLVAERLAPASAALAAVAASATACTTAVAEADGDAPPAAVARLTDGALLVLADAAAAGAELAVAADGEARVLDGLLPHVPGAGAADALLLLSDDDGTGGGPAAFLVDLAAEGIELRPAPARTGLRGDRAATVALQGVRVAPDAISLGVGAVAAARAHRRLAAGAIALGVGHAALSLAVDYLQERRQFGQPLGAFRALRDRTGALAADLDAAGALLHATIRRPDALRAGGAGAVARAVLVATETAVRVSVEAVQLHGGYGYTDEYRVSRLMRDAASIRAAAGGARALRAASATPALAALGEAR